MKLIGSFASPFVRRIRISAQKQELNFIPIDVFSDEGQDYLKQYGPIRRVPILVDKNQVVWDSMLIHKYLFHEVFGLALEKELVLINEANDTALLLLQFKNFKLDPNYKNALSLNLLTRLNDILQYFELQAERKELAWDTKGIWLFCLLDWLSFRKIIPWESSFRHLLAFRDDKLDLEIIKRTAPEIYT